MPLMSLQKDPVSIKSLRFTLDIVILSVVFVIIVVVVIILIVIVVIDTIDVLTKIPGLYPVW